MSLRLLYCHFILPISARRPCSRLAVFMPHSRPFSAGALCSQATAQQGCKALVRPHSPAPGKGSHTLLSFLLSVRAGIYQNFNPAPTWRGILLQKGGETWHTNATRLGGPRSTRAWKRSKAKLMPISPPARGTP